MNKFKKRIVSGITPTSYLTLPHYLIILKNLIKLQEKYELYFLIGDLHTVNTKKNKIIQPFLTIEAAKFVFSCGLKEDVVYIQSQLKETLSLNFFLSSFQSLGGLEKMKPFKLKISEGKTPCLGLFSYPILMATDILLFDANILVGSDQKQHFELTKEIVRKINNKYENLFKIPELIFKEETEKKIRDLQFPEKKMSKSIDNKISTIFLNDSNELIRKKILKCKTDSENIIKYDFKNKPGISNLIFIFSLCEDIEIEEAETRLKKECSDYLQLKEKISNSIIKTLKPIKEKIEYFNKNPSIIEENLNKGLKRAEKITKKKMNLINEKTGFPFRYFQK